MPGRLPGSAQSAEDAEEESQDALKPGSAVLAPLCAPSHVQEALSPVSPRHWSRPPGHSNSPVTEHLPRTWQGVHMCSLSHRMHHWPHLTDEQSAAQRGRNLPELPARLEWCPSSHPLAQIPGPSPPHPWPWHSASPQPSPPAPQLTSSQPLLIRQLPASPSGHAALRTLRVPRPSPNMCCSPRGLQGFRVASSLTLEMVRCGALLLFPLIPSFNLLDSFSGG